MLVWRSCGSILAGRVRCGHCMAPRPALAGVARCGMPLLAGSLLAQDAKDMPRSSRLLPRYFFLARLSRTMSFAKSCRYFNRLRTFSRQFFLHRTRGSMRGRGWWRAGLDRRCCLGAFVRCFGFSGFGGVRSGGAGSVAGSASASRSLKKPMSPCMSVA